MVAGPSLQEHLIITKQSFSQKDSIVSGPKSAHKNSLVGPCYNSDTEDNMHQEHLCGQQKVKDEVNREAKNWK